MLRDIKVTLDVSSVSSFFLYIVRKKYKIKTKRRSINEEFLFINFMKLQRMTTMKKPGKKIHRKNKPRGR